MLEKLTAAGCTRWADRIDFFRADIDRNVNIGYVTPEGEVVVDPLMRGFVDELLDGATASPAPAPSPAKPTTRKKKSAASVEKEPVVEPVAENPVETTESLLDSLHGSLVDE